MNINIRKLKPELAEDYARFFETTPYWDNLAKDDQPCYCVSWRNDNTYVGNDDHWYPTREERRSRAIQFVKEGGIQGYLAYNDDEIVGWCSATADCQGGVNYMREYYPIDEYRPDIKVKSIFCFMVAPKMHRAGVATKLVEYICMDAEKDGFDYVEAYPNREYAPPDCRGPLAMYIKCGFYECAEREGRVAVRKKLSNIGI